MENLLKNPQELISTLSHQIEVLHKKNEILESSIKGAMKENTVLNVDINVLKERLKKLEKETPQNQNQSLEILQNRLDYKIQECENLYDHVEELEEINKKLEEMIQNYARKDQEMAKYQNQIKALQTVIQSMESETENLKRELKKLRK